MYFVSSGWWFVSTSTGQGWAPSTYLERDDGADDRRVSVTDARGTSKTFIVHAML